MRLIRSLPLALAAMTLVACVSIEDRAPAFVEPPPTALVPDEPYARSMHRFELDASGGDVIGALQVTRAQHEDTFVDLARRFNVGYDELVRANPKIDPWLPGEGREILLPTQHVLPNAPREGIVINLAAMRLFYFTRRSAQEPQVVYTFPIGIGRVGFATPEGRTRVTRMAQNPSWRPGPGVRRERRAQGEVLPAVVPPGPDNPLGSRALYLSWPGYLIHGTNQPAGIGLRSSAGCIRLFPEDVELLYELVKPGIPVTVVNQPIVFGERDGVILAQAFDVLEDDRRDVRTLAKRGMSRSIVARVQAALDPQTLTRLTNAPRGVPLRLADGDDKAGSDVLESVRASAQRVRNALPIGATWSGEGE